MKLNQKGAIQFLIPIFLIGGIIATVWLLTAGPLNFIPKALNLISSPISAPVPPKFEPPVVSHFVVSTDPGSLNVQMKVTCTPIPNQKIITAIFSFGDATPDFTFNYVGNIGASANLGTSHVYKQAGKYIAGVRCKDDNNSVSLPENVVVTLTAPTPTPAPSASYRRVFVTSSTFNGNLQSAGSKFGLGDATSGLDGADKVCQGSADIAKLGGTWKAWISDSRTSASYRLEHASVPYKLLNNVTIANNWDDLTDGTLQNPINITEFITTPNYMSCVWSSTDVKGDLIPPAANVIGCYDYTDAGSYYAMCGRNGSTDSNWTKWSSDRCDQSHPVYCFEQGGVTTTTPTPEPTATPSNVGVGSPGGGGGGGGGGGSTPTQNTRIIRYFRYAESVAGLSVAKWNSYTYGVAVAYEFKDTTPGPKFILVQFADGTDTIKQIIPINGQSYVTSAAVFLEAPASSNPPQVDIPVSGPAPLSSDGPNCPFENPQPYGIGTLYKMCSVDQLARFDLKWLVDFPNNILIDIGTRKGDLGGFLANFSSERLLGVKGNGVDYTGSGFDTDILKQLPDWRKQKFSTDVQNQLGIKSGGRVVCEVHSYITSGNAPLTVNLFYGAAGYGGSNGYVTNVQWDFDGDGQWDTPMNYDSQKVTHTYYNVGNYTVKMHLETSDGLTSDICNGSIIVN